MFLSNIIHIEQVVFENIYVCAYTEMHVTIINEKDQEFGREQVHVYGRVGGKKEENNVTIS